MNNTENQNIEPPNENKPPTENKPAKKRNPPQTCPLKHSNWFLTINSQKNMNSYGEIEKKSIVEKFSSVVREFYNQRLRTYEFLKVEGSKQGESFNLSRSEPREELLKRIKDTQVKFVIEIGPESYKLHSHGLIALSKRGLDTKLDYNKIREWLKNQLGYEIHFDVQLFNDAKKSLETYMQKAPIV
jgi:hypothetical protein